MAKEKLLNIRVNEGYRDLLNQVAKAMRIPCAQLILTSTEEKLKREAETNNEVKEILQHHASLFPSGFLTRN